MLAMSRATPRPLLVGYGYRHVLEVLNPVASLRVERFEAAHFEWEVRRARGIERLRPLGRAHGSEDREPQVRSEMGERDEVPSSEELDLNVLRDLTRNREEAIIKAMEPEPAGLIQPAATGRLSFAPRVRPLKLIVTPTASSHSRPAISEMKECLCHRRSNARSGRGPYPESFRRTTAQLHRNRRSRSF